jgi:hypothetical protein
MKKQNRIKTQILQLKMEIHYALKYDRINKARKLHDQLNELENKLK